MKFRQKSSERAIYKILDLFAGIMFFLGTFSLLYTVLMCILIFAASDNSEAAGTIVGLLIGGIIITILQFFIFWKVASIRDDMVDYPDSEL